jgi:hypothetical protein
VVEEADDAVVGVNSDVRVVKNDGIVVVGEVFRWGLCLPRALSDGRKLDYSSLLVFLLVVSSSNRVSSGLRWVITKGIPSQTAGVANTTERGKTRAGMYQNRLGVVRVQSL